MRSSHNCFVNWGNPQSASTLLICSMEMNPLSAIWLASENHSALITLTKLYAAYVLLLVLHACRLHIRAAYEYMHAAREQEGTNWSCVHQDFLHMCSTHLLVCGYVSLECSTLEFGQKMRAACVQHFCKGTLPAVIGNGMEDFRLLVKMRSAKCRVHLP